MQCPQCMSAPWVPWGCVTCPPERQPRFAGEAAGQPKVAIGRTTHGKLSYLITRRVIRLPGRLSPVCHRSSWHMPREPRACERWKQKCPKCVDHCPFGEVSMKAGTSPRARCTVQGRYDEHYKDERSPGRLSHRPVDYRDFIYRARHEGSRRYQLRLLWVRANSS